MTLSFASAWELWKHKGHNPAEKLCFFEGGLGYQVGLLDYMTLTDYIFPDDRTHMSREAAFAAVGRALDAGAGDDSE